MTRGAVNSVLNMRNPMHPIVGTCGMIWDTLSGKINLLNCFFDNFNRRVDQSNFFTCTPALISKLMYYFIVNLSRSKPVGFLHCRVTFVLSIYWAHCFIVYVNRGGVIYMNKWNLWSGPDRYLYPSCPAGRRAGGCGPCDDDADYYVIWVTWHPCMTTPIIMWFWPIMAHFGKIDLRVVPIAKWHNVNRYKYQ